MSRHGTDTVALARSVPTVTTVEANPLHAAMLRHNLSASGITNVEVVVARAEDFLE